MSDLIALPWIKIEGLGNLPKKPGLKSYEHIDCLIWLKGEAIQSAWNCEHGVWDDWSGDDHLANPLEPSHYLVITKPAA